MVCFVIWPSKRRRILTYVQILLPSSIVQFPRFRSLDFKMYGDEWQKTMFLVPRSPSVRFGVRSFYVSGPRTRNALPVYIGIAVTPELFGAQLNTFFKSITHNKIILTYYLCFICMFLMLINFIYFISVFTPSLDFISDWFLIVPWYPRIYKAL